MSVNAIPPQINIQAQSKPRACDTSCTCCKTAPIPSDSVEIQGKKTFFQKAKSACKKTGSFVNENRTIIRSSIKGVGQGLLNACTILGASQIIDKVTKAKTTKLAATLAVIGGVGIVVSQAIKENKRLKNQDKVMANT